MATNRSQAARNPLRRMWLQLGQLVFCTGNHGGTIIIMTAEKLDARPRDVLRVERAHGDHHRPSQP